MEYLSDTKIASAVIAASTALTLAMVTHLYKFISEFYEKKRKDHAIIMAIYNEIAVNKALANLSKKHTRTLGIHFQDKVWSSLDTSVIYKRNLPSKTILKLYECVSIFNILSSRRNAIKADDDYKNKQEQLAIEHAEMIKITESILDFSDEILHKIIEK